MLVVFLSRKQVGIVSEQNKDQEQKATGSWPEDSLQRAFVEGAKWWEFQKTGATMWQEDQGKAEQAAIDRYGLMPTVDGFEMWMFNLKELEDCLLFMGGEWVIGWQCKQDIPKFQTYDRTMDWDNDNQPTRWKPLP